ncbi:DUF3800 domain-containing protein [Hyphobacterium sp.]|uniref:DUF3800 domain-containing protein n=1 Tax=Hyphobacterium sp. TaxID=2004662 RepID=UPI00374996E4
MTDFSDFLVFADESGSAVLEGGDPQYPIFVLSFIMVRKDDYADRVVPQIQRLKFDFVGHDQLILHERDIRRQSGAFAFLQTSEDIREAFIERINSIVENSSFDLIAATVHKDELKARYANPFDPYALALQFCLERLVARMMELGQQNRHVHVVFESRGNAEDRKLELDFRRIVDNDARWGWKQTNFKKFDWTPLFIDKKSNSAGLQLADLTARPIGLSRLRPDQPNRAAELLREKLVFPGTKHFP